MSDVTPEIDGAILMTLAKVVFPQIHTPALVLDRLNENDLHAVHRFASDPEIIAQVSWPRHQSLDDTYRFLQSIENHLHVTAPNAMISWAIRDRATSGPAMGIIHFSQFSEIAGQIDFVLGREHWNRGIVTEAARHLIGWIFLHYPKIRRIQAHCVSEHAASRRVMEKCGMQFEGIRRDGIQMKNKVFDLAIYSVLRCDAVI